MNILIPMHQLINAPLRGLIFAQPSRARMPGGPRARGRGIVTEKPLAMVPDRRA